MSVTKLKPTRTPRTMDEWTAENASACEETARNSKNIIQQSKKLIQQAKEIGTRVEPKLKKDGSKKAG